MGTGTGYPRGTLGLKGGGTRCLSARSGVGARVGSAGAGAGAAAGAGAGASTPPKQAPQLQFRAIEDLAEDLHDLLDLDAEALGDSSDHGGWRLGGAAWLNPHCPRSLGKAIPRGCPK